MPKSLKHLLKEAHKLRRYDENGMLSRNVDIDDVELLIKNAYIESIKKCISKLNNLEILSKEHPSL